MNFVNKIVDKSGDLFSNATSGFNKLLRLVPSASGSILYNKWILYFIAIISLVDMARFYMHGNTNAVMLFFAVGLLTTFFSKNMTVVLVIALALTHLVSYGTKSLEGLDNQEEEDDEEEDAAEEEDNTQSKEDTTNVKEEEAMTDNKKKQPDSFESIAETAKTVSLLSKDAKDLPTQTVELLNKQKELMANMTQLQPLLKKAEELVKTESFATMSRGPVYAEYK